MIVVIARFRAEPDLLDELIGLLKEVQAASREDDGCLNYGYYAELADPTSYVAVEEWRDMDALAAHLRQPHVARLLAALPEHAISSMEVKAHVVERSEPLPL